MIFMFRRYIIERNKMSDFGVEKLEKSMDQLNLVFAVPAGCVALAFIAVSYFSDTFPENFVNNQKANSISAPAPK